LLQSSITNYKIPLLLVLLLLSSRESQAGASTKLFQPHRAFYEMSLGKIKNNSDIIGVEGRMIFEWRRLCDGWSVNQRYLMRYQRDIANDIVTDAEYNSWESNDGTRYRFNINHRMPKERNSNIEGTATYSSGQKSGVVQFKAPKRKEYKLPMLTMFPSNHTFALLDAAQAKKNFLVVPVFDGSELETAVSVSSVIGAKKTLKEKKSNLLPANYWPIRMAFFPAKDTQISPSYEITINIHENGVSSSLVLDYQDYTVNVKLVKLEPIKQPLC
jgi:hypothetical protein